MTRTAKQILGMSCAVAAIMLLSWE